MGCWPSHRQHQRLQHQCKDRLDLHRWECENQYQSSTILGKHNSPRWSDGWFLIRASRNQHHTSHPQWPKNYKPVKNGRVKQKVSSCYQLMNHTAGCVTKCFNRRRPTSLLMSLARLKSSLPPIWASIKWSQWMVDGTATRGNPEDMNCSMAIWAVASYDKKNKAVLTR